MKYNSLIRFLLLAAMAAVVTIAAGCDARSADDSALVGNNDGGDNPPPDNPTNFCTNPNKQFKVTNIKPPDGATDVGTNPDIVVSFNYKPDVNSLTNQANIGLETTSDDSVPTTVNVIGKKAHFSPVENLENDTTYVIYFKSDGVKFGPEAACPKGSGPKYLTITGNNGQQTNGGNGLESSFTTQKPYCKDPNQLFYIKSFQPKDGTTGVARGVSVVVTFSAPVAPPSLKNSVTSGAIGLETAGSSPSNVDITYKVNGNTATFTPKDTLKAEQKYRFFINTSPGSNTGPKAEQCAGTGNQKLLTIVQRDNNGNVVKGQNGNPVPATKNNGKPVTSTDITFTTSKKNPLKITSFKPQDGKTVGTDVRPSVTFNQGVTVTPTGPDALIKIYKGKCSSNLQNKSTVNGSISKSSNGQTVTFVKKNGTLFKNDTDYCYVIDPKGVSDADGNATKKAVQKKKINFHTNTILNTQTCAASVAGPGEKPGPDGICLLGENGKGGLVDVLLNDQTGPLAPLASQLGGKDELAADLRTLLQSDDGSLQSIVRGLIVDGNLQQGLRKLLLDPDTGLQTILTEILQGNEQGKGGLQGLLGTKGGAASLLQALLIDGNNSQKCQSSLGTVCLIGEGNKSGVLDTLLGEKGYLGQEGLATPTLLNALETTLQNNGSLGNTVQNLFQKGQLVDGLNELLNPSNGTPGLVKTLQNILGSLPDVLKNVLGGLLGGLGGLFGNLTP